jgi:ubiquinone/menaquinone biosynthesis C-methylase UbiE
MAEYRYSKDHIGEQHYADFFRDLDDHGWDEAMQRLTSRKDIIKPHKIPLYLSDQRRNDFIFLLPISPETVALDYGSGWGNTSYTLSRYCKKVVAMEADPGRLKFATAHFRHRGADNITPIQAGNGTSLPFEAETFDLVIMNGVLEWTPRSINGNPEDVHRRVLAEVNRVLKPGGTLQISIENRFGYDFLLGKRDHHCGGLRWVPFLPRPLANLYSWMWLRQPYRTWFYSYGALRRFVSTAGFSSTKVYSYFKNHVRYSHMFLLDDEENVARKFKEIESSQRLTWKDRLAYRLGVRLGMFRWIAQDFMVISQKD